MCRVVSEITVPKMSDRDGHSSSVSAAKITKPSFHTYWSSLPSFSTVEYMSLDETESSILMSSTFRPERNYVTGTLIFHSNVLTLQQWIFYTFDKVSASENIRYVALALRLEFYLDFRFREQRSRIEDTLAELLRIRKPGYGHASLITKHRIIYTSQCLKDNFQYVQSYDYAVHGPSNRCSLIACCR